MRSTRAQVERAMVGVAMALVVLTSGVTPGCQGADDEGTAQAAAAQGAAAQLATHLAALAEILERGRARPDDAIKELRLYLERHGEALRALPGAIEGQLAASEGEEARAAQAAAQHAAVSAAMRRFAEAQRVFREGAGEAQRIELSYVLRSLR